MEVEMNDRDPDPISTEEEYRAALEQVAHGWGSSASEDDEFNELMDRIAAYEASFGPGGPSTASTPDGGSEQLKVDVADVAGWLHCRYLGLVDEVVAYRHPDRPPRELAAVVTSQVPEADWRVIRTEVEDSLRALGYVIAPDWRHLAKAFCSPKVAEMSQHRRLQGYKRVGQALRAP